jgi:hypothetical protein
MNTQENNRLIAEFMELPTDLANEGVDLQYRLFSGTWYEEHELSYNVSWDWLMPVVEKCFVKQEEVSDDLSFKLNDALLETNIESLYRVVVEFIKQYNK